MEPPGNWVACWPQGQPHRARSWSWSSSESDFTIRWSSNRTRSNPVSLVKMMLFPPTKTLVLDLMGSRFPYNWYFSGHHPDSHVQNHHPNNPLQSWGSLQVQRFICFGRRWKGGEIFWISSKIAADCWCFKFLRIFVKCWYCFMYILYIGCYVNSILSYVFLSFVVVSAYPPSLDAVEMSRG